MSDNAITVPIKEYVDTAVSHERELREAIERADIEARNSAKIVIDSRLESMNELREQINNERGQYIGREVFDRVVGAFESRLRMVEGFKDNINGRIVMLGGIMALLNLIVVAFMAWWTKR